MKRMMVYSPAADACSWYRAAGPWSKIAKSKMAPMRDIQFDFVSKSSYSAFPTNWDTASFYDVAFFQRPYHADLFRAMRIFKNGGTKIWLDYDDILDDIPYSNFAAYIYQKENTKKNVGQMLEMADVVTVTTEFLRERLQKQTKAEVKVIPNAWDFDLLPYPDLPEKKNVILWRGTASHQADLYCVRHELYEICKENPDWQMVFLGFLPWWYQEDKKEFPEGWLPNMTPVYLDGDILQFFDILKQINPKIVVIPLNDNDFNRGKSNIAWMESAWVGAECVAPDWEEWEKPGILNSGIVSDFVDTGLKSNLNAMIKGLYFKSKEKPKEFIQENLALSKVNEKRIEILDKLI